MLLTSAMDDLLTDGFQHFIVEQELPRWSPGMAIVFTQMETSKPNEDVSEIGAFGLMSVKSEAGSVVYDDPVQAFDTTFTPEEYVLASEVSEIMLEDDQYNVIRQMPSQLFTSFDSTIETLAANHFNNGFANQTADTMTGGDGRALFDLSHPLMGGGVLKNELTNAADIDATSYEQATIDISDWTDHRGKKLRFTPQNLIVPSEQVWTAEKLFGSALDPDSANNAINPASSRRLKIVENAYLTDTDAWFIQCSQHYMRWYWRRHVRTGRDNDFATANFRYKIDFRASSGWWSPLGMFGSPGA